MRKHVSVIRYAVVGVLVLVGGELFAQTPQTPPPTWTPDIKFASGREVVPYLEGWIKNPDESFDFIFGYYSRNSEQELAIAAGPENSVMPGGPDRGQPTFFLARRQPRIYRVRVPKDWGDKALTWSITANGHTEKVVAKLVPAYEKDERFLLTDNRTTMVFGEEDLNKPPTLSVPSTLTATVGSPLTLAAQVTDDGLPRPRTVAAPKPAAPQTEASRFQSQRNNSNPRPAPPGLRVTWLQYRGPGKVVFASQTAPVADGAAVTTARFSVPGTYTLFATANDGKLSTRTQLTVTVK